MFSLYELEISAYMAHTMLLCKLGKGTPCRQTNFQKGPLPFYSLIQAAGLGQRNMGKILVLI